MQVKLIDHMGSDLSVVNAARVSFNKESELVKVELKPMGVRRFKYVLSEPDTKLIKYLAKHNHWTPFGHTAITLHVKAPLFVARQLGKHQVGMVWNEVSRRYVTDEPEFYEPEVWRKAADNVKQGSSDEAVPHDGWYPDNYGSKEPPEYNDWSGEWFAWGDPVMALGVYKDMINAGVCPEQARMVLPQSMYTEWYWTGNLKSFANVYNLRTDSHTQRETQEVAKQIGEVIGKLFPISWKELTNGT